MSGPGQNDERGQAPDQGDWRAELRREYAQALPDKYARIDRCLSALLLAPDDAAALEALLEAVHRLHGSAGTYGFVELGRLAGEWEDELLALRAAGRRPPPEVLDHMPARFDGLRRAAGQALSPHQPPARTRASTTSSGT